MIGENGFEVIFTIIFEVQTMTLILSEKKKFTSTQ